jgi:hypothetical protein
MRNWRSRMEGVSKILLSERRGFGISNQSRPIWRVAGIPLSVADSVLCLGSLTGRTRLATRKSQRWSEFIAYIFNCGKGVGHHDVRTFVLVIQLSYG